MTQPRPVLVIDFGAQYAQLIARRVREARVYSEVVPHTMPVSEMLAKDPAAIILSGGPSSVYEPGAPSVDASIYDLDVPIFGICYGFQLMAQALGGTVTKTGLREFGSTPLAATRSCALFDGLPESQDVWMSHGDSVSAAPAGYTVIASSAGAPVAGFEHLVSRRAGVQFHPEVGHTRHGQAVLEHFLYDVAGIEPTWTPESIVEQQVAAIRAQIGDKEVICGLSGGVDSAVAAALVHSAVGESRPEPCRVSSTVRPGATAEGTARVTVGVSALSGPVTRTAITTVMHGSAKLFPASPVFRGERWGEGLISSGSVPQ